MKFQHLTFYYILCRAKRNAEEPEFFHQNRKKSKKGGNGKPRGARASYRESRQGTGSLGKLQRVKASNEEAWRDLCSPGNLKFSPILLGNPLHIVLYYICRGLCLCIAPEHSAVAPSMARICINEKGRKELKKCCLRI